MRLRGLKGRGGLLPRPSIRRKTSDDLHRNAAPTSVASIRSTSSSGWPPSTNGPSIGPRRTKFQFWSRASSPITTSPSPGCRIWNRCMSAVRSISRRPPHKRAAIGELTQLINEQLWLGHFDQWSQQDVVMFRHALCLAGGAGANDAQCGAVVKAALDACETYYQAFQFVLWANRATARGDGVRHVRDPRSGLKAPARGTGARARLRVRAAPSHFRASPPAF